MSTSHPDDILIRDESIRLGQLLKLANLAEDGLEAKAFIEHGAVNVNGEVETRRGRQVRHGDVVELDGHAIRVVSEAQAN
ncbi:RNA-binding S4 domain-containing protein [Neomicrococcus aestuarii]|uniref:RNA-binding protein n=1 Tax=Neomicrococcus aestuarii TaxID=556325 RepID=A0A1L2ZMG8_9MICC|nr:RNA-binding S4 domain-containing protein [Neomicrococcus aestuarii]APF40407.1 RNA-binding protein [Neomicrococcus aestuarii]MBB5511512.1 ribosome-associated protein [Neomicrococcus aestuarii]